MRDVKRITFYVSTFYGLARLSDRRHDMDVPGLFVTKAQMIAAEAELNRIAQRCSPDNFDTGAVAEAHLQQATAQFRISPHRKHAPPATDAEAVEAARFWRPTVTARRKITCLLHIQTLAKRLPQSIAR